MPSTHLMSRYLSHTSEFFEMKNNKTFQDTVHLNDIQHLKTFRQRSENSLLMQARIFKHRLFIFFMLSFSITGKKYPSLNPDIRSQPPSSLLLRVHEAKRDPESLFKFSSKGLSITAVIPLPAPFVWHLEV